VKILHTVEYYSPSIGGMQEVVRQLSERLVASGHSVTVATSSRPDRAAGVLNGVAIQSFDIQGSQVRGMTGDVLAYERFLLESEFDVVANFAAQQWATDVALPILPQIKGRKVFVPTGFSGLFNPKYEGYFEQMKGWMRSYDATVYLSKDYRDYRFGLEQGLENMVIIPNGAGEDEFETLPELDLRNSLGIPRDDFLILLVGSHTGLKGHREAMAMFKAANLPKSTLLIVANDPQEGCGERCARRAARFRRSPIRLLDRKQILVAELTREQTLAAYKAADIFLFPSQIECSPLVIFEAMASGTPFLSTDVGNVAELARFGGGELLPGKADEEGLTHADIAASAKMLAAMRKDRHTRTEMARKGREAWKDNFTWEGIATRYEDLYQTLLAPESGKTRADIG